MSDSPATQYKSNNGTALQWIALAILFVYLLSPILLQPLLRGGAGRIDLLLAFNLATSILWVSTIHFVSRRPFILHVILFPLYITTAANLLLMANFDERLSASYITMVLTDYGDTGNFLATYARPVSVAAATMAVIYIVGLCSIRTLRKRRSPRLAVLSGTLLVLAYGAALGRDLRLGFGMWGSSRDIISKEDSAPFGALFQAGLAFDLHEDALDLLAQRASFSLHARKVPDGREEIYVWVIGESSRPLDWSLFGYSRDTNPRLNRIKHIILFPNMLTTAPHTAVAVPSMLSLYPITDWDAILSHPSIITAFKEVGFRTFWLSTQSVDGWGGYIPEVAAEASYVRYYDHDYDGAMLGEFQRILNSAPHNAKLLIILHTLGSHFEYSRKYPKAFAKFVTVNGSYRQNLVDEYDNSVLYTDWFLSKLISALAKKHAVSALIYASDHGENLLDDDRQLLGHAIGNRYDLHTASFVWLSKTTRQLFPHFVVNAERNATKPLSLSNLPQSLLDLAGIKADGYNERMSIFNEKFRPELRSYIVRGTLRHEG